MQYPDTRMYFISSSQVPVREYMRQNVTGGQIDVEKVKAGVSPFFPISCFILLRFLAVPIATFSS